MTSPQMVVHRMALYTAGFENGATDHVPTDAPGDHPEYVEHPDYRAGWADGKVARAVALQARAQSLAAETMAEMLPGGLSFLDDLAAHMKTR